jgi:hypothetical protein
MRRCPEIDPARQCGTVLVVSLVLAGLIATLAALAMQSATLDQQSVAATRFRLRAFAAAEYCVTLLTNTLIEAVPPALPADISLTPVPGMPAERMRCRLQLIGPDAGVAVRSGGTLTGTHYTVLANGSSTRNAQAAVEQGVLLVRDTAGTLQSATPSYWLRLD